MECCGNCTLCCKFPVIPEVKSKPGEYCYYCKPDFGCEIYEQRPNSCRIFLCAWTQMKEQNINVSNELRPDKCHVLFEKYSDNVIVGVTEKELSDLVLNQINCFKNSGISVLIADYIKKTKTYFLVKEHTKELVRKEIYDRSKLYRRFR